MTLLANLKVPQGTTWSSDTWALLDDQGLGMPLDGWTVRAVVRARADDELALFTFTSVGPDATVRVDSADLPVEGGDPIETVAITLHLTAAQSAALGFTSGVYDCLATREDVAYRIVQGGFRVSRAVTR